MKYFRIKQYADEELLALSGIQHFYFCKRQWGLIHVENQWKDDVRTVEGSYIHRKADNPFDNEVRNDVMITRSVPLVSHTLGLRGIADIVEYIPSQMGVKLPGHDGLWLVRPVEYKRGRPKIDMRDEVQLCAQAICLEEMLGAQIKRAELYYHETRRRVTVSLTDTLREIVYTLSNEMHELFRKGITPPAESGKPCHYCSLSDICIPKLTRKKRMVNRYISKYVEEVIKEHDLPTDEVY